MTYYTVKYTGPFGFIKPWTAVRDSGGGKTYSQQFLTPSIIEGIRQKLEVTEIARHKLQHSGVSEQKEVIKAKMWKSSGTKKQKTYSRESSIAMRGVFLNPVLYLAFTSKEDAEKAAKQHICLCRNEDVLLPDSAIEEMSEDEFDTLAGFELRFGNIDGAFLVGFNRFDNATPMYGKLEITGNPINDTEYEQYR